MATRKEIKKLTWIYFWQQNRKEILNGLGNVAITYLLIGWIVGLLFLMFVWEDDISNGWIYTGNWWGFIPIALWLFIVVIFFGFIFIGWIKSNWKKAEKSAKIKLNYIKIGKAVK